MGKNVKRLLRFAITYPGWHSYGKDRSTVSAIAALEHYEFIEVNRKTRQFRLNTPKDETKRFRVGGTDEYATLEEANHAANKLHAETGIIASVEEIHPEPTVIVNYAGGYMDCRINRNPDNTATTEWRTMKDLDHPDEMKTDGTTEHNTPRDALLAVAKRLGW